MSQLVVAPRLGLRVLSCGLFVSEGRGTHPERTLDTYELVFVRSGTLSMWERNRRFDVQPGQALLLWPGRRHRGAAPYGQSLSFYWIHFWLKGQKARQGLVVPQHTSITRPDYVSELFHRYLDDQETGTLKDLDAALLATMILCEAARAPAAISGPNNVLVGRVESYVSSHLIEPLSTSVIAAALHANPDYLNRVFRREQHMTLTEYIHRRRLRDAKQLLRERTDTIADIASSCGFPDVSQFRRLFRRHFGLTPTAYRALNARAHVNVR